MRSWTTWVTDATSERCMRVPTPTSWARWQGEEEEKEEGDHSRHSRESLQLLHMLAYFYRDMGEHVLAMARLKLCLTARTAVLGSADLDTLESLEYFGTATVGTEALRRALKAYHADSNVGPTHERTLGCMGALGKNLTAVGFVKEASEIMLARLELIVQAAKDEGRRETHPCTLAARIEYAEVLIVAGNHLAVAKLKLSKVMTRQKSLYGADAPETLRLMDKMVILLSTLGHHKQALALNLDCVEEKKATLGEDHSGTVKSIFNLAETYIELGQLKDVQALGLEEILSLQEQRLSMTHPTAISSAVKLGGLYSKMGNYPQALAVMQSCYDRRMAIGFAGPPPRADPGCGQQHRRHLVVHGQVRGRKGEYTIAPWRRCCSPWVMGTRPLSV